MNVRSSLFDEVLRRSSPDLRSVVAAFEDARETSLHLAVFVEPYLSYILDGSKTVESRFSNRAIPPHRRVAPGDVILLKPSGKPIIGWCRAGAVWDYELDPSSWSEIRDRFASALRVQDGFWQSRAAARYATLIRVEEVKATTPTSIDKRDRRGWVVLSDRSCGRLL